MAYVTRWMISRVCLYPFWNRCRMRRQDLNLLALGLLMEFWPGVAGILLSRGCSTV